jgi:hypothetical protein
VVEPSLQPGPHRPGYEAIRPLVRRATAGVEVRERAHIRLAFEGGAALTIPLDDPSAGPEAAHFRSGPGEPLQVWQ